MPGVQEGPVGTLHPKASLKPKTGEVVVGSSPTLTDEFVDTTVEESRRGAPLPWDELQDSAGDSDDSDSLLGSCNKLNKQLLESNAELLLHKQELDDDEGEIDGSVESDSESEEETLDEQVLDDGKHEGEEENEERRFGLH